MRPKISKKEFLNTNPQNLVCLIGEPLKIMEEVISNETQRKLISKRLQLCELLSRIEFTMESYGTVNFFIDYQHDIPDLLKLSNLLEEFEELDVIRSIEKTVDFFEKHKARFDYLKKHPDDFNAKHEELHNEYIKLDKPLTGVWYSIPLHKSMERLATYIRDNPDEFCVNENGKSMRE